MTNMLCTTLQSERETRKYAIDAAEQAYHAHHNCEEHGCPAPPALSAEDQAECDFLQSQDSETSR